jgi:signal transduction histidine kinase/ActR/RegA family two-component response regulator
MTPSRNTVRSKLLGLVLAFTIPTILAALGSISYVYKQERRNFDRGVAEATRALSLVVERELARREAIVRTLSFSPTLDEPDLVSFYNYASETAPTDDTVIVLSDPSGQQLVNTRSSLGDPLPKTVFAGGQEAINGQDALVSNLYFAPIGKQYSFAVQVPVVRNGRTIYYLSMGGFAKQLQTVLSDQRLPPGWIGSVIDRKGVIVARSIAADDIVGKSVTPDMLRNLNLGQEGAFQTVAVDGTPVYASFSKSATYGWGFIIGVPRLPVTSAIKAASAFGLIAMLLIAAAVISSLRAGRKLLDPMTALVEAADRLGRGDVVEARPTGLVETDKVAEAMAAASRSLRTASATMEKRVTDALAGAERAQRAVIENQRLEAMGHLTGGVAHDFNNLLMVVNNNTHLLKLKKPELEEDAQVAGIERAVATGAKLTRQLLAFSRRQALRPEVIDLADRLPDLLGLIRTSLPSNVEVSCKVAPDTAPIIVDPAELELALINLALNARDAIEQGGGSLSVRARNVPKGALEGLDDSLVEIEVRDNGRGIAPDDLARAFEPFFTTKGVGHGTGLGLSQVYGFATQAGGTARIESEPGSGTAVRLFLRASSPGLQGLQTPPPAEVRLSAKVLLVEDNEELAEVTQEILELSGCSVQRVRSGDEAVLELKRVNHAYEAVLSDIRMPGEIDGIALAEHVRREQSRVAVVLMTGYSAELTKAAQRQLDVLQKPCTPQALVAALASALELKRAAR